MSQENPKIYGYGDDFVSFEAIESAIKARKEEGVDDLMGAAVVWLKKGENLFDRIGVRVLPDGSISLAHAEHY